MSDLRDSSAILVTGANGYVGAGIYAYLKKRTQNVYGTFHSHQLLSELLKLDVTKKDEVQQIVKKVKPSVIIHVAANPDSRWCETRKAEAIALNEQGTAYIVRGANEIGAKVILISTLAVLNKSSVYGQTKATSEELVKHTNQGWVVLRPSLTLGLSPNTTNDRPFNRLLRNIEGVPAMYDDIRKYQPTWLKHLNEIILAVLTKPIIHQTIPVAVPEPKSRYEMAEDILSPFGITVTSEHKPDNSPDLVADLQILTRLKLPRYSYEEIVIGIRKEIEEYLHTKSICKNNQQH